MQIPEKHKLFYNPIWMPSEESACLFGCIIPEDVTIKNVNSLLLYLKDRYKSIIINAFKLHGRKVFDWYHEYVDENYWYQDEQDLVHCFFESDLWNYEVTNLKERESQNIAPDFLLETNEIDLIENWNEILILLNSRRQ